nr:CusA/CzcA family heavy metal efflux RND transporter [Bacteriovorax sp. HI3]
MLNKIIHFSVFNRYSVLALTLLVAIAGVFAFQKLPIDAVPDITNNQVQVNTPVEGLAPEEIERTITQPVEAGLRGIADVEQIRSITRFGLSQVTIVFKDKVDIYRARQLVSERLQGISSALPSGITPEIGPISSGLGEIYQYIIDFEKVDPTKEGRLKQLMELKSIQEWTIKPRLLSVAGVAEINTSGGFEKQFHIIPNMAKMASYNIHFDDITEALEKVNRNVGGGSVEQTAEQFLIQGIGLLKNEEEILNVPVKKLESLKVIRIKDFASVKLGKEIRTGSATHNGKEAVLGTVMMLIGENSRTVSLRVDEKIEEIKKALPKGVALTTVYDRSVLVNATLGTVEHNLMFGAILVIVVLFILLGNVRAAIITAVTIPLTLLATFLIMKPLGLSGNLMSLGALDFGIIVDGTVIVLDNCVRYIHELKKKYGRKLTRAEIMQAVYDATVEIRLAAGFGELVVVAVFIPVFGLTGVEGKMFLPMALTFAIAVFCALIFSFTMAPALASIILSGDAEEKEPKFMELLKKIYRPVLDFSIYNPKKIMAIGALSVALGVGLFMTRGSEFLPQLSEGSFAFHMIRPVNIGLDQSIKFQEKAEEIIKEFPEVDHVFSRIGTSEVATDPMGVNVSDTYIMLNDVKSWPKVVNKKQTHEMLVQRIIARLQEELPGQNYLASQPIQMRFNELLEGTRADVAVKIFGPDMKTLMNYAKETKEIIEKVPGAGDVEEDLAGTSPVLRVFPKNDVLASIGASTGDVLDSVEIALGGKEVGVLYEENKKFPIIVRLSEDERSDLDVIKKIPVGVSESLTVPLNQVAQTEFSETYGSITREDSNRRSAVLVNLRGRDTESFVHEARALVDEKIKLPEGYYFKWGGNFENLQVAKSRLLVLTPLALGLVLMMIYAAFGNVKETFLVFSCVPMALVGGVIGLIANSLPFSISAGVGFIALSGIAVLNGVVLVNFFNQLKKEGLIGVEILRTGAMVRLRPVLMTAMVAVFGFLPMMLSTGVGAEVQRPLASVVIGGIISSTLLTLVVVPSLYGAFILKLKPSHREHSSSTVGETAGYEV